MNRKTQKFLYQILADVLLAGVILCVFAYFHHIRTIWGGVEIPDDPGGFTRPEDSSGNEPTPSDGEKPTPSDGEKPTPSDGYDRSGDFGKKFYDKFLKDGEDVISTSDEYRSRDIAIRVTKVDKAPKVTYFIYDIYVRNVENIYTTYAGRTTSFDSLLKGSSGDIGGVTHLPALAAINTDFWTVNAKNLAVRNGKILRNKNVSYSRDLLVMYYDGTMETVSPAQYDYNRIAARSPYQVWGFGPSLLRADGSVLTADEVKAMNTAYGGILTRNNPRTAVGYYEPGHYCFLVVDGRNSGVSDGLVVTEMSQIFADLGCKVAYNMDGGASSQAYFNGEMIRYKGRNLPDLLCVGEISRTKGDDGQ